MRLPEWLDRPIVTLLIGLAITAVIVPFAARRWTSKQKEQEIKTDLVSDIAINMMQLITRATLARDSILARDRQKSSHPGKWPYLLGRSRLEVKDKAAASEVVKEELATFELKRQVIATKLEAYFGPVGIPECWDHLCDSVEQLCELWDMSPKFPCGELEDLKQDIKVLWRTLGLTQAYLEEAKKDLEYDLRKENRKGDREWRWARMQLLYCKASIIRKILHDRMPVYAWWLSKARRDYRKAEKKHVASPHGVRAP